MRERKEKNVLRDFNNRLNPVKGATNFTCWDAAMGEGGHVTMLPPGGGSINKGLRLRSLNGADSFTDTLGGADTGSSRCADSGGVWGPRGHESSKMWSLQQRRQFQQTRVTQLPQPLQGGRCTSAAGTAGWQMRVERGDECWVQRQQGRWVFHSLNKSWEVSTGKYRHSQGEL